MRNSKILIVASIIIATLFIVYATQSVITTNKKMKSQEFQLETIQKKYDTLENNNKKTESQLENIKKDKGTLEKKIEEYKNKTESLEKEKEDLNVKLQAKVKKQKQDALLASNVVTYGEAGGRGATTGGTTGKVSAGNVGNMYAPGNCTWYVYNRKPNIGSYWGDANQWVGSAQRDGYQTGNAPASGSIGVEKTGNHVVYVESDNKDGTVTVSEMNYGGLYRTNVRTVAASYFTYIYA